MFWKNISVAFITFSCMQVVCMAFELSNIFHCIVIALNSDCVKRETLFSKFWSCSNNALIFSILNNSCQIGWSMFSDCGSKFSNFGNFNPLLENIEHSSLKVYSKYRKYLSIENISYSDLFQNDIDPLYAIHRKHYGKAMFQIVLLLFMYLCHNWVNMEYRAYIFDISNWM